MDLFKKLTKMNEYARVGSDGLISDITYFIDTGSYMFNALLSGSLFGGIPGNRIANFAGAPSVGKSTLTLLILKNFLDLNPKNRVVFFETEGALTKEGLLGWKIDIDRFMHMPVNCIEDLTVQFVQALQMINEERENGYDIEKDGNIFIVVDSIGQLTSNSKLENALKGEIKADVGRAAGLIRDFFRLITLKLTFLKIPAIFCLHTYDSLNMYAPKGITGGQGALYAGSLIVEISAAKEKEGVDVVGINMKVTSRKSRTSKQWQSVPLYMDYKTGLDRYAGLLEFGVDCGYIKKDGKGYLIEDKKYSSKEINANAKEIFTEKVLKELDVYVHEKFQYGSLLDDEEIKEEIKNEPLVSDLDSLDEPDCFEDVDEVED